MNSITYLSIGNVPHSGYDLRIQNGSAELNHFWPSKITGIDKSGTFFDGKSKKKLVYDADVEIGKTDIYGRLVFPCDIEKEVLVRAQKDDYELVEMKTTIRPGMLLYFRMGNSSYYAESAEKELDKNNLQNALKMIDKALQIDNRQDWNYLKTIIIRRIQHEE